MSESLDIPASSTPTVQDSGTSYRPLDYDLKGTILQSITFSLRPGERVLAQVGRMNWISDSINLKSTLGGAGKVFSRFSSGEPLFLNEFSCTNTSGKVCLAPCLPGKIEPITLDKDTPRLIAQKGSFLACEPTIDHRAVMNRNLSAGLIGGEGYIMQEFSGKGRVFIEVTGELINIALAKGQELQIDQGALVAYEDTVDYSMTTIKGKFNWLFSGEGIFIAKLTGPGRVWLQTSSAKSFLNSF